VMMGSKVHKKEPRTTNLLQKLMVMDAP